MIELIGFGGRMRSGKGELSSVCEEHGYQRLTFALPLKKLCADLLGITLEEEDRLKNENAPIEFAFNDENIDKLAEATSIERNLIADEHQGKVLTTVRELLQVIGTDIIRKHNTDWHVNQIENMLEEGNKYVFDDVRFPNEKAMIERHGGDTWFVVRPTLSNVSNHISETALKWQDFDNNVIINSKTLYNLKFKWETFLENYEENKRKRKTLLDLRLKTQEQEDVGDLSVYDMLLIDDDLINYSPFDHEIGDLCEIYETADKQVCVECKGSMPLLIHNALLIEDLKIYL